MLGNCYMKNCMSQTKKNTTIQHNTDEKYTNRRKEKTERKAKVLWQRKAGKGILTGLRFFQPYIMYLLFLTCINNALNLYIRNTYNKINIQNLLWKVFRL